MEKVKIVERVKITQLNVLYKDGQPANAIEIAKFSFENGDECGFSVVVGKGLYVIGSEAIYIQPDYCLSSTVPLFESFVAPEGNPNKSRLGKNNRIRAIKFNFSLSEDSLDPVYSNGILMPLDEVKSFLDMETIPVDLDLAETLEITKYEEPESLGNGQSAGEFPSYAYKTDENNIMNIKGYIEKFIASHPGESFGFTLKRDGSSFSQFTRKTEDSFDNTICSRGQTKRSDTTQVIGYKNDTEEFTKYFDKESKSLKWRGKVSELLISNEEAEQTLTPITVEIKDAWIELSKKSGLFDGALKYCEKHSVELGFRGEIFGSGLKGSGNKNNPDAKNPAQLVLFGIDDLSTGYSVRQHYGNEHNLKKVAEEIGVQYTEVFECVPNSFQDLIDFGNNIFESEAKEGRIIEGVVIRTMNSNVVSCKYMNDIYDASK